MNEACIIHIEDEFEEYVGLVNFVATWLEDFYDSKVEPTLNVECTFAASSIIAVSDDPENTWVVHEIKTRKKNTFRIRYIFIRDATIPEPLVKHFCKERIFILDVLRPLGGETDMGVSVQSSLESARSHNGDIENMVLFTAHQGNGLEQIDANLPRKISKNNPDEIEDFICEFLARVIDNG